MMMQHTARHPEPTVHIVDDDASVRKALSLLVRSAGLRAETYASAREFLYRYRPDGPDCLVLDIRMPEMDGLELQAVLTENGDPIPIIMVSGQGDIPMAVRAIKQGALDFIEKPFPQGRLLQLVKLALDRDEQEHTRHARCADIQEHTRHARCADIAQRMASLTRREQDVLGGLVQGKQSKVVAAELGISSRTVEAHRAHILRKLGACSLPELVRMILTQEDDESEKYYG
jgi:FixJ family two-component response regulator